MVSTLIFLLNHENELITMFAGGDWLPGGITLTGRWSMMAPVSIRAYLSGSCHAPGNRESAIIVIGNADNTILLRVELVRQPPKQLRPAGVSLYAVVTVTDPRLRPEWSCSAMLRMEG
jgi:hypothetical protein